MVWDFKILHKTSLGNYFWQQLQEYTFRAQYYYLKLCHWRRYLQRTEHKHKSGASKKFITFFEMSITLTPNKCNGPDYVFMYVSSARLLYTFQVQIAYILPQTDSEAKCYQTIWGNTGNKLKCISKMVLHLGTLCKSIPRGISTWTSTKPFGTQ